MRTHDRKDRSVLALTVFLSIVAGTASGAGAEDRAVFRMTSLNLRDPHVYISFLGCRDVTDTPLVGYSVNGETANQIAVDGDGDGYLDLSLLLMLRSTSDAAECDVLTLADGLCLAPATTTECRPYVDGHSFSEPFSTSSVGICLAPFVGTTRPYAPAIASSSAPCFAAAGTTISLFSGGLPFVLEGTSVGGTLVGDPPTQVTNGLLRGFLRESVANSTIIPNSFPLLGGQALSAILPGGDPPGTGASCALHSDLDLGLDGVTRGWWSITTSPRRLFRFYVNTPPIST